MNLNTVVFWDLLLHFKLNVFPSISYCSVWDIIYWLPAIKDGNLGHLCAYLLSPTTSHCGCSIKVNVPCTWARSCAIVTFLFVYNFSLHNWKWSLKHLLIKKNIYHQFIFQLSFRNLLLFKIIRYSVSGILFIISMASLLGLFILGSPLVIIGFSLLFFRDRSSTFWIPCLKLSWLTFPPLF